MSTVVEIESALRELPEREAWQVAGWLQEYLSEKWNRQIDEDIAAGRLDRLADQALADYRAGQRPPPRAGIQQRWGRRGDARPWCR